MLLNPIIGMIHNTTAETWHPVVFVESPLPGPPSPDKPIRHKSKGHHTTGFKTRDEAVAEATAMKARMTGDSIGEPRLVLDRDFPWDGNGIPAMVEYFIEVNGVLSPTG